MPKTDCQVDCVGDWGTWTACNEITGQITSIGQRTRTINITINPLNGGRTCPVPQIQNCTPSITNISPGIITGDITNSTDKFMIFKTGTSSFTVKSGGVNCDILMIGGGGAGGYYGGGGGAGACIVAIGRTLPSGVCNVTVGAGGAGGGTARLLPGWTDASPGGDSSISVGTTILYLAKGGGRGAFGSNNGDSGGCGGGAGTGFGSTRSGGNDVSTNIVNGVPNIGPTNQPTFAVFGTRGGNQEDSTSNNSTYSCAGGGGIGAAAPNHAINIVAAGPGGAGLNQARINGITYNFKSYFANNNPFGDINGYIGGGGSGKAYSNLTQADGGIGGGGKGVANSITGKISAIPATAGLANTGSGGGGGNGDGYASNGFVYFEGNSSGGSGIVIIRYRS